MRRAALGAVLQSRADGGSVFYNNFVDVCLREDLAAVLRDGPLECRRPRVFDPKEEDRPKNAAPPRRDDDDY